MVTWRPFKSSSSPRHWAGVTQSPYASMTWLCGEQEFPTVILVISGVTASNCTQDLESLRTAFRANQNVSFQVGVMEKGTAILHPKSPSSVSRHLPLPLSFPQREGREGRSSPEV
ncbi:hypothetical protein E2320_022609 [Naja naja]|nr:hypothetical protein E2320_022609 [Naja naja]